MNACAGCGKNLEGKYLTVGAERYHAECFACSQCKTELQGKAAARRNGRFICADCAGGSKCQRCGETIRLGQKDLEVQGMHFHEATCLLCAEPTCRAPIAKEHLYIGKNAAKDIFCKNHTYV
jgi:hypothetical protein